MTNIDKIYTLPLTLEWCYKILIPSYRETVINYTVLLASFCRSGEIEIPEILLKT